MKKLFVAIIGVAVGLFVSLGFATLAHSHSHSPTSEVAEARPAETAQTRPATPAPNRVTPANLMMSVDRQFVMTAAEAGLANLAMGELALQKSNNAQVRQFAQSEITEQQQIKQALSGVAPQLGIALPTTPGPKYQALMARLSQLSGEQFNRAYLSEGGVNAHLENAALFQREAQFGQEAAVVAIANRSLPTIQSHFNTASGLTNYRFAQVSQRFNTSDTTGTPQNNRVPGALTTPNNSEVR